MKNVHACSFRSVSSFKEADRDSWDSPLTAGTTLDDEVRRTAAEFREEGARDDAADRAVAPLAIEGGGGVGDADTVRRVDGAVRGGGAVVAMGNM